MLLEETHCLRLHSPEELETNILHHMLTSEFQEVVFSITEHEREDKEKD